MNSAVPSGENEILTATEDDELRLCYAVIVQLRPAFSESEFLRQVRVQQREHGYRLVYIPINGSAAAVAGYRLGQSLSWGRFLYVDDLVTDSGMRSMGLGQRLINWLFDEARRQECQTMHLDSGVHRFEAHRFYIGNGLEIRSHHFTKIVS